MRDGRLARGEARRAALVAATLAVVERSGVTGVSHRSVALEAGVPASSVVYYFPSVDALLTAALTTSADEVRQAVRALPPTAAAIAGFLVSALTEHRSRTLAGYELYLQAARNPTLRPAARQWLTALLAAFGDTTRVRALLAGVDGLLLQGLIADTPPRYADVLQVVSLLMPEHPEKSSQ
ncbi:TetR family transcriptional regulator [Actinosynnema sp. NPDC020468]|uniref:TetR/AcrR family transcriptional regulator n=1 Tax=Actinosynnema sp. NPDC020468 TaxID=3154488 RepID=UPI0033D9E0B2